MRIATGRGIPLSGRSCAPAVVVLAAAFILRLLASFDDFWLDEIWSWVFAAKAGSLWGILTEIRHDNNHILNTWLLHLLGEDRHWISYRIPAVLSGTATVYLAGRVSGRQGTADRLAAMLLTGASFLLIQYSSEARGYTYVLFFSLLSWALARRSRENDSWPVDFGLSLTAVLGFLSHLTYLFCYLPILIWTFLRPPEGRRRLWPARQARPHLLPILFLAWFYPVGVRDMAVGGGARQSLGEVVARAASLALGGPESGMAAAAAALAVAAAFVAGLVHIRRAEGDTWLFYLLAVIGVPAAVVVLFPPQVLYARYFLVPLIFLQLVLGRLLARLYRRSPLGKSAAAALLAAILCGNAIHAGRLLHTGRGGYTEALAMIRKETGEGMVSIGSDNDFRNPLLLAYFQRRERGSSPMVYFTRNRLPREGPVWEFLRNQGPAFILSDGTWPREGPRWLLLHSQERSFRPRPEVRGPLENSYSLVRFFPYAGLSGWHWAVYRNRNF